MNKKQLSEGDGVIVRVDGVTKYFGERKILEDVSLEIKGNSLNVITGISGSGKTTLLGMISGLLKPDTGTVFFKGHDIFNWFDLRRSRFRNKEIGFVFQFFNLLPDLTAYQNIIYPAVIGFSLKRVHKEIDYLIDFLSIREIINQYPATLSGGELQRVAVARAIINKPLLVLADEPTGNLDEKTGDDILKLFLEIRERYGIAFVIVTHDSRFAARADRTYNLEGARLVEQKTAAQKKAPSVRKKTQASKKKVSKKVSKKKTQKGKNKIHKGKK